MQSTGDLGDVDGPGPAVSRVPRRERGDSTAQALWKRLSGTG
jgi:hypothetical protein